MENKVRKGLEGVVAAETAMSYINGEQGELIYRGHHAKELAINEGFESACHLLWYGDLPDKNKLDKIKQEFRDARQLSDYVERIIHFLPPETPMMSVIRTCVSALGDKERAWPPSVEEAIRLTAVIPVMIAMRQRVLEGKDMIAPHPTLDHVANYLYMLTGNEPSKAHVKALDAYFVLTMEHGMNASTFTSRVVTSSESDMVSAVTGAIGTMKGPLHGGAPTEVTSMLESVGMKENAEKWLRQRLENGEKLMGFGHRIYKTKDPRAEALKEVTRGLTAEDTWLDLAAHVEETAIRLLEEYKPGRKLYTNVEFYAAAVLRAVSMPNSLFTPTFTAARVAGWTAHIIEQANDNRIYRPQSLYTGDKPVS
ncbi:citrate synthase/methylcitrate synthase [Salipaludibacillus sp. LMS25]|jgi:citrate synthase|uniref:citrate synthase/methylcitrate synthase n=1 Tax=Salipaludibacillus sp. LMS25 TaxID=2924031 RepID=UPI0020D027FB|nr:citrate synthase/methylcitrate synthase [Salipaludibacillus sp. LMS25]UTR15766.1 citrate synthase/methylcitrate synthase [Salipaludibacillus sp. LMS25]